MIDNIINQFLWQLVHSVVCRVTYLDKWCEQERESLPASGQMTVLLKPLLEISRELPDHMASKNVGWGNAVTGITRTTMNTQDTVLDNLLSTNAQWASDVYDSEPEFFSQCAKGQAPQVAYNLPCLHSS